MKSRLLAAAAVLACVIMTTTGCFAQPDPEPTPLFSSEEEAFAAAEETYRSYVDALNQVDLSDPETFEEVYAWTTGDANAVRAQVALADARRWLASSVARRRVIRLTADRPTTSRFRRLFSDACLDVSDS